MSLDNIRSCVNYELILENIEVNIFGKIDCIKSDEKNMEVSFEYFLESTLELQQFIEIAVDQFIKIIKMKTNIQFDKLVIFGDIESVDHRLIKYPSFFAIRNSKYKIFRIKVEKEMLFDYVSEKSTLCEVIDFIKEIDDDLILYY